MTIREFIKRLVMFDVFWGRRSKMYHGIKDGGAKATLIGDSSQAIISGGSTIFNVNHPSVDPLGGHFHSIGGGSGGGDQNFLIAIDSSIVFSIDAGFVFWNGM
jgi:hypothetical protein